jgi:hypothetical protein
MARAALFLLVLGCRPVPDTGGEFFAVRAEVFCERLEECDATLFGVAYASQDDCVSAKRAEQDRQNEACSYDRSYADDCLDELEALPCDRILAGLECSQPVLSCP